MIETANATPSTWVWSDEQNPIFAWFAKDENFFTDFEVTVDVDGNLVVRARAGTGKTTTIIEGVNRAPESSILLAAFNKRIADELAGRITNPNAEAKTLHAVGFACVRKYITGVNVAKPVYSRENLLTETVCGSNVPLAIQKLVTTLHTKGREIVPHARNMGDLTEILIQFECEPDDQWADKFDSAFIEAKALEAMELAATDMRLIKQTGIDFADMIFLPVRNGWMAKIYDMVVVDEAQDMTNAQLELALGVCKGRVCIVGDDRQAIYGFRGADSGSIDRLKTQLDAAELSLNTTRRCARVIVEAAQKLVPDFKMHESNPEGAIEFIMKDQLVASIENGDFLLSRLNAPLVVYAMAMLKQGKRARIAGKDIGKGLKSLIAKLNKGRAQNSVPEFLKKLANWQERETERYLAAKRYDRADFVADQAEMLTTLAADAKSVRDVEFKIDSLFTDDGLGQAGVITCSSVHKAKGLEATRVFVLKDTLYPRKKADREEQNIEYVAITRAKQTLVWVLKDSTSGGRISHAGGA